MHSYRKKIDVNVLCLQLLYNSKITTFKIKQMVNQKENTITRQKGLGSGLNSMEGKKETIKNC